MMDNMKAIKISMLLAVLIAGGFVQQATAQTAERTPLTAEARAQKWTDWMKKELTLTTEQEPEVHAINIKYADQVDDIKAEEGDRRSKFTEVRETNKAKDEELKAVLTPEQFTKYTEKKQERRQKMRENRKRGG
jgi:Spy/CpxP family protein refolding chaperone